MSTKNRKTDWVNPMPAHPTRPPWAEPGRVALGAALTLVALAGGCVNQRQEVAHYRRVLHSHPATAPAALRVPQRLTLAVAMRLANDNNEQLAISGENYLQALIAKNRAFATFLPHVGLSVQDFQQKEFNTTGLPPDFSQFFQTHYFNLPLQTNLNINALHDAALIQAAGTTARQRRALLLDLQSTLLLEVAQTYYQILSDQRAVRVLRTTLRVQQANLASMRRKEKAGIAIRLDVLQSAADTAATRVQLTAIRNRLENGRATLAFQIGVPSLNGARLRNQFNPPAKVPSLVRLDQMAMRRRQDLRAAAYAVVAARQQVTAAIGEYFPSVSVNLDTFLSKQSFPSDSWWSGLFSVNLPLFEGGMIYADVRTAYSQWRQARLEQLRLQRQIREQVRVARDNWHTAVRMVRNLRTEWAAAQAAFEQARHSYGVGLATNLDVITAEDRALASQLAYEQARYTVRVDMLDLLRTTGRLNYSSIARLAKAQPATRLSRF